MAEPESTKPKTDSAEDLFSTLSAVEWTYDHTRHDHARAYQNSDMRIIHEMHEMITEESEKRRKAVLLHETFERFVDEVKDLRTTAQQG